MMGDFAVWAITDLSTGELMYLIDDNGGSEILDFILTFSDRKLKHVIREPRDLKFMSFNSKGIKQNQLVLKSLS